MSMIRRLLALDGVNVVCHFRDDGYLIEGYGLMSHNDMGRLAQFAHDYRRIAQGNVDWVEHLGDQNHLHVTVGGHKLVTLADADSGLSVGDQVALELVNPLFFAQDGNRVRG